MLYNCSTLIALMVEENLFSINYTPGKLLHVNKDSYYTILIGIEGMVIELKLTLAVKL